MAENVLYSEAWGGQDLKTNLAQIGNNHFWEHGDISKFIAEKVHEAEGIFSFVKAEKHEVGVEIGSGTGVHTVYFAERSAFVYSFDVTDGFLPIFEQVTAGTPNIRRTRKDFFPMLDSLADGSVDYVYSSSVFCHLHVYDVYLYFEEIARVLKQGGRFYVNYQNADNMEFNDFFMLFLNNYREKGIFEPIHPAQMQFHSNAYFLALAKRYGMEVAHERVIGTYSEYIFRKV